MATLEEDGESTLARPKKVRLEDDIHNALVRLVPDHPRTVHEYARFEIGGRKFAASHATYRDSIVYFQPLGGNRLVVGVVRKIFEAGDSFLGRPQIRTLAKRPLSEVPWLWSDC